ncbi:MAG: hypothetical protein JSU82_12600 [Rhodospirillales bacterium]|nr:MAG: hypothetical protein JSU82_12600 [Rhodospirillales bacterium]
MITRILALPLAAVLLTLSVTAHAYIGPGAGASLAGSLLAVLAAIATAVAIVLLWPLRLLYKKIKRDKRITAEDIVAVEDTQQTTSTGAAE